MTEQFTFPEMAQSTYLAAKPFPHAVFEGAWPEGALRSCKQEIEGFSQWDGEKDFYGARKKRYCGNPDHLPPSVLKIISEASTPAFIQWLENLTGEKGLVADPHLEGGGVHRILPGGFLKMHADFNWHKQLEMYRRLNVLIYLNPDWQDEWDGRLELWSSDMTQREVAVSPRINTMVIFTTDDASMHGHPNPLNCPSGIARDSIALYYYSATKPERNFEAPRTGTNYQPMPGEVFDKKRRKSLTSRLKRKFMRLLDKS